MFQQSLHILWFSWGIEEKRQSLTGGALLLFYQGGTAHVRRESQHCYFGRKEPI